jgi:hypothetical protein
MKARPQQIVVLEGVGFSSEQIARTLPAGVSCEQLRGMLRYRQCVDPAFDAAGSDVCASIVAGPAQP